MQKTQTEAVMLNILGRKHNNLTISCPEAAGELRPDLVIRNHRHTHAPTTQSPSPHMGLKTSGLTPALPRLFPLRLTAPESALTVLPCVTTKPGQMKQNQWAPPIFKRAELERGEINTSRRKSPESRQENDSVLLFIFHQVKNPHVLLKCKVENLWDQSAALQKSKQL